MGNKTQAPNHDLSCRISWNSLSLPEWQARFEMVRRANLLQSYDYARALCPLRHQTARWGLIYIKGEEAGLVQVMEAGFLKNLVHAVILDRGPLWFEGYGTDEHITAFFKAFDQEFPARFGRRRRIIPEAPYIHENLPYKRLDRPGYQTIWLDLMVPESELRTGLRQKWRNMLNKAEKKALTVEWSDDGTFFPWLLGVYQKDKAHKGYQGASPRLLKAMARIFGSQNRFLIGRVMDGKEPVAAILVLCHGLSATYQIGWTGEKGRKVAAQNFLLWQTVLKLKEMGIKDFDLGGINDETAKNIKKFKEGLGGETVTLAGQYF